MNLRTIARDVAGGVMALGVAFLWLVIAYGFTGCRLAGPGGNPVAPQEARDTVVVHQGGLSEEPPQ